MSDFSRVIKTYNAARPDYPLGFFDDILNLVPRAKSGEPLCIWDCATGPNATVSRSLTGALLRSSFSQTPTLIHATDIDPDILAAGQESYATHAIKHDAVSVRFTQASAEEGPPIDKPELMLIGIGNALHWFDTEKFFKTVHDKSHPDALLVAWTHPLQPHLSELPEANIILTKLHKILYRLELPESQKFVTGGYKNLYFPFAEEAELPPRVITKEMDLNTLCQYYTSVYSINSGEEQRAKLENRVRGLLSDAWGEPTRTHECSWMLDARAARVGSFKPTQP